ncbi:MAG: protein translocase subunit SecD [Gemmatimonadaceae bacterium]
MSRLRTRLLLIGIMIAGSIFMLFPRNVIERVKRGDGFAYDTVRRVPLKLGLDLQGGMYLALEVDESKQAVADKSDALERALKVVRTRIDQFGVSEPIVQKVGSDRITVELPGIDDPQRATDVVEKQAFLQFQIVDETQSFEKALSRLDQILKDLNVEVGAAVSGDTATRPAGSLQKLLTSADTSKSDSARKDTLATPTTGGPLSRRVQVGQIPGEYFVTTRDMLIVQQYLQMPAIQAALPPGKEVLWGSDTISLGGQDYRAMYVVDARPIITGDYLQDARPNQSPIDGTIVEFQLSNEGGRQFRRETGRHVQDYMAIVLDDRVMGRPPVIQQAIGTRGQITMGQGRDLREAQDLALVLRAGSLPVPLKIAEVRNIGASLGADAIRQGLSAGALGIALVILIMIVYYRFSGFLAVTGLTFYALTTLAILAGFNATLTLPGLAGFVLSIGMAVDANFLIFERIREELARGKTVRTAVNEGFDRAWSAIVDTHVTTALTAAILYQFGTGPVRGFAVALLAGLASSMVSAIFVVRTLFMLWLDRNKATETLSI